MRSSCGALARLQRTPRSALPTQATVASLLPRTASSALRMTPPARLFAHESHPPKPPGSTPHAQHAAHGEAYGPQPVTGTKVKAPGALGQVDAAMFIAFTCKVCSHRNRKSFSRLSYEKGVVLIRCGGCTNLHLIADNLGWFDGAKNVEAELARRGESVARSASVLEFSDVLLPRSLRHAALPHTHAAPSSDLHDAKS